MVVGNLQLQKVMLRHGQTGSQKSKAAYEVLPYLEGELELRFMIHKFSCKFMARSKLPR
jgi:hypothetical protein